MAYGKGLSRFQAKPLNVFSSLAVPGAAGIINCVVFIHDIVAGQEAFVRQR